MRTKIQTFRNVAIIAGVLLVSAFVLLSHSGLIAAQTQPGPLLGYAWSDNTGWIDLNCANQNTCATLPFAITADMNGALSGLAWSENIGWISANATDLTGCPQAPCTATYQNNTLSGWFRALSGGTSQSGGWDGFISLSGAGYGITGPGSITNVLGGWGWGSTVIGWLTLSLPNLPAQCTPIYSCVGNALHNSCTNQDNLCPSGYICVAGGCTCASSSCTPIAPPSAAFRVTPKLLAKSQSTHVIWSASNVSSCVVSVSNGNIPDTWTAISGSQQSSPITEQTTFLLTCVGNDGSTLTETATVNIIPSFQEN